MSQPAADNMKAHRRRAPGPAMVTPFEAESLAPQAVPAVNAFYRRRPPVRLALGGESVTLAANWLGRDTAASRQTAIVFRVGAQSGQLRLPASLVARWIARADPEADVERLAPQHAALLIESLLRDSIAWLEGELGQAIELTAVEDCSRSEEHTSELQSRENLVCRLLLEKKNR